MSYFIYGELSVSLVRTRIHKINVKFWMFDTYSFTNTRVVDTCIFHLDLFINTYSDHDVYIHYKINLDKHRQTRTTYS